MWSMGYDAWLEKPYQDRYEDEERHRCPDCDDTSLDLSRAHTHGEIHCTNDDCDYYATDPRT